MMQMNLFTKQKQRHRHKEETQTFEHQWAKTGVGCTEWLGLIYIYIHTSMYNIHK